MTLKQVNEYFSYMMEKHYYPLNQFILKHNILDVNYHTLNKYIIDKEYKLETFRLLLLNYRKTTAMHLLERDFVSTEDILELQAKYGDMFYLLPDEAYKINHDLIDYVVKEDSIIFDSLPPIVRADVRIQQKCKRTKAIYTNNSRDDQGYDNNWLNESGELLDFFKLENGFPINSKEDYHVILKYYVSSGMSVSGFCSQYGITPVEGFQDFLKRCGVENTDTQELITENKAVASNKYVQTVKKIASDINEKKITIDDYIENYYTPVHKITLLLSFINDKEDFMSQLLDYMYNNRTELKLGIIMDLFDSNIAKIQDDLKATIRIACGNQPNLIRKIYTIKLANYTHAFRRELAKCKYIKDNKEYIIDDDIIDQALAYAEDKNIYKCYYTITDIAKRIAYGEIKYDEEAKRKRSELISGIIELALRQAKTIDDYMATMEEVHNNMKL